MKVQFVFHYYKEDSECHGDYWSVDVMVDDELAISYGDDYHDKGWHKAVGFLDALKFIHGEERVILELSKTIADADY